MNQELIKYIEDNVFPIYKKNDKAHDISHIKYAIERSFELNSSLKIDPNIIYTAAAYHDIGHYLDAKNHEIVSAKIFSDDKEIKKFFDENQRKIIIEAIEDHRASLGREPRNIYGKLLSSADRNIDLDSSLRRTYIYGLKHYPDYTINQQIERAFDHIKNKFGNEGYAKMYIKDGKYEQHLKNINKLLSNKDDFIKRFKEINDI